MPMLDIPSLRKKLLALQEQLKLLSSTSDGSSQIVELDQARVGRLSRMDALQAQAMSQATDRRRELMLKGIEAALLRMDKDDYGQCRSCDEPINPKRLEYDPTALLCIQCAEQAE